MKPSVDSDLHQIQFPEHNMGEGVGMSKSGPHTFRLRHSFGIYVRKITNTAHETPTQSTGNINEVGQCGFQLRNATHKQTGDTK